MSVSKHTFLVFACCCIANMAFGQKFYPRERLEPPANPAQTAAYFQKGLRYMKADSVKSAWHLFNCIMVYDSASKEAAIIKKMEDSLVVLHMQAFRDHFIGRWNWIGDGSNWGESETPKTCHCTRHLEITDSTITYFQNDTLLKVFRYAFEQRSAIVYSPDFIVLKINNDEKWVAEFNDTTWPIRVGQSSKNKDFLMFNTWYGCACGCPNEVYQRDSP